MAKALRTYRSTALLTVFALVTSAFAPLSSVCGMEVSETTPVLETPVNPPCHATGGPEAGHTMPMEHEAPASDEEGTDAVYLSSCCVAQAPTAPSTETAPKLSIATAELHTDAEITRTNELAFVLANGESASPRLSVSLHVLFGCFLT